MAILKCYSILRTAARHCGKNKGGEKMLYYNMVCKQNRQKKNSTWTSREPKFVMPISEKKTWTVTGVLRKDV